MSYIKRTLLQCHTDKGLAMSALTKWREWRAVQTDPEALARADAHIARLEREIARWVPS